MNRQLVHIILCSGVAIVPIGRLRDHKRLRVLQLELERIAGRSVGLVLLVGCHWRWVFGVLLHFVVFLILIM